MVPGNALEPANSLNVVKGVVLHCVCVCVHACTLLYTSVFLLYDYLFIYFIMCWEFISKCVLLPTILRMVLLIISGL